MYEAAEVDGAGLWARYWRLTLPLCRPALAALATLLTTWIYNDFFWAITLISTGGKRPVTSALANLQGQFVSNQNLIAAAAMIVAMPTLVVYLLLQKQFIAGLLSAQQRADPDGSAPPTGRRGRRTSTEPLGGPPDRDPPPPCAIPGCIGTESHSATSRRFLCGSVCWRSTSQRAGEGSRPPVRLLTREGLPCILASSPMTTTPFGPP